MTSDGPGLATSHTLRFTDGRNRRSRWRYAAPIAVGIVSIAVLLDGQTGRSDNLQMRACLEPVYAGLFGTGSRALERCVRTRAKLFGARDGQWLRYVHHLEAACPVSIGMQGQAICEFSVKAKEDHIGKGWRTEYD